MGGAKKALRPFWVDLHLHTVLSPCADLDMGAPEIVARYREENIALAAVTDHNHVGNFPALHDAAGENNPLFLPGMEIQSMEDIHLVVIFSSPEEALSFKEWLWFRMPPIRNQEDVFGYQLIIDAGNDILEQVENLLVQGAQYTVDEIAYRATSLGAIVIPAHLDRPAFSYEAVLGPLPDDFPCTALEMSPHVSHAELARWKNRYPNRTLIRSSDAHRLADISRSRCTPMLMEEASFDELRMALRGEDGRKVLFP